MATDPNEETNVDQPEVSASDLMKATEGNPIQTEDGVQVAPTTTDPIPSAPSTDESGTATSDTPPEQTTPAPGGENLEVPSARGPAGPPTDAVTASAADEASPSGGANIAGTPQSQLDQAPPMADESGSNIPAPNLVQPPAEGALSTSPQASAGALDPMLVNPTETAKARVEGRTSDAATRAEGTHIDDVPSDINDGVKPSDGGLEAYPFPQGGDVDIATIPESSGEGEYWPALTVEDTVKLGQHELIPERLEGRRAFITDAPRYLVPVGQEENVWITVQTRDEVNATLTIPLSAVEIQRGGVDNTVRG